MLAPHSYLCMQTYICVCAHIKHIVRCEEDGSLCQHIEKNSEPLCQHTETIRLFTTDVFEAIFCSQNTFLFSSTDGYWESQQMHCS